MSFLPGTTFVFGSWIYEADGDGKLQSCLLKETELDNVIISPMEEDQLAQKIAKLSTSDSTQRKREDDYKSDLEDETETDPNPGSIFKMPSPYPLGLRNTTSIVQEYNSGCCRFHLGSKNGKHFLMGLHNSATTYQAALQDSFNLVHKIPLGGAQTGLVMIVTPQDCIVHCSGSLATERTQLNNYLEGLPYQEGKELYDSTTEVISSSDEEEPRQKYKEAKKVIPEEFIWRNAHSPD